MNDVLRLSALAQAALIRRGKLSSEELTRAYLARIDARNGELACFVDVIHERAILDAKRCDRKNVRSADLPLFWGVPTGIKDLDPTRGTFTRFGSRAFQHFYSVQDTKTPASLREGGFVVVGKTSTSELGTMPIVETDIHPPTRNPWNLDYTAGGSSGGAGSAVAAGLLPIAPGSDGAGSIRIPSSFNGLFGHKPSRGRVPNNFGLDDRKIIYTAGPMARTVDDAAAMLDVLAGISVGKPHWAPPPPRSFLELAKRPPPPLRIRFTTATPLAKTHGDVALAVMRVVEALEELGHRVDEGEMPPGDVEEFLPVWQFMAAEAPVHDPDELQPLTRWLAEHGKGVSEADVERLVAQLAARVLAWFGDDVDLWVTPTVPGLPPRIGAWRHLAPPDAFAAAVELGPFTAPFNVSGLPAASLPIGMSGGLPIGVQLVGKPLADAQVLAVSRLLEDALPWRDRPLPFERPE